MQIDQNRCGYLHVLIAKYTLDSYDQKCIYVSMFKRFERFLFLVKVPCPTKAGQGHFLFLTSNFLLLTSTFLLLTSNF